MHAAVKMLSTRITALRSLVQASQDGESTPAPPPTPQIHLKAGPDPSYL